MIATRKAKPSKARKPVDLAKSVEALHEFRDDPKVQGHHPDSELKGLFIHVGPRKLVWRYRRQRMTHGLRKMTFKTLGEYPGVGVEAARNAALIAAGRHADGKGEPGKRGAVKFESAWEAYLDRLLTKARKNGKPARHHSNAVKLGNNLILPTWGKWSLFDMSTSARAVADWHRKMTRLHGPVSANRAAQLVRAAYKRWDRDTDDDLPAKLPTSKIEWNEEKPSQKAMGTPAEFKAWRAAWDKLGSDIHKGYFLFCLLTGCRPGEAARLRLQDVNTETRMLTIPNVKTPQGRRDVSLPITPQIAYAIAVAVNAPPTSPTITMKGLRGMKPGEVRIVARKKPHHEIIEKDLLFPGCKQMPSCSGLPMAGNALRHTYRTLHVGLGIYGTLSSFLLGHSLDGVNEKYIAEFLVIQGPALREAQEKISCHVFELLGLKLGGHHDAQLVPDAPTGSEPPGKRAKPPSRRAFEMG